MGKFIDMTGWHMWEHGQPKSHITVLKRDTEFDKKRNGRPIRWICKCELCGTIKSIEGAELRRTKKPTLSCGCEAEKKHKEFGKVTFRDLTNQRFGNLIIICKVGTNKYGYALWKCQCDCGNSCIVSSRELLNKETTSCGCLKNSTREFYINKWLNEHNIKYIPEYSYYDLKDKLPLRFDFAIQKNGQIIALIEHQGRQHYEGNWCTETLQLHDNMKKEYCLNHNIPLYEIKYNENYLVRLEQIFQEIGY